MSKLKNRSRFSENIEKCRVCNFFGDCNWVKVANTDIADFVQFLFFCWP